jgi:hypothetical protein
MQVLLSIASAENERIRNWELDFEGVSLSAPPGGWQNPTVDIEAEVLARRAEAFRVQRDTQAAAMQVVKEMHLVSNAENAISGGSFYNSGFACVPRLGVQRHLVR